MELTRAAVIGHIIFICLHSDHFVNQVPLAMDLLLAEFHRACIYTVPKHIVYSEVMFIYLENPFVNIVCDFDHVLRTICNFMLKVDSRYIRCSVNY